MGTYYLHPKGGEGIANIKQAQGDENALLEHSEAESTDDLSPQKRTGSLMLFRLDGTTM